MAQSGFLELVMLLLLMTLLLQAWSSGIEMTLLYWMAPRDGWDEDHGAGFVVVCLVVPQGGRNKSPLKCGTRWSSKKKKMSLNPSVS